MRKIDVLDGTLLAPLARAEGVYTDAFETTGAASLAELVGAFYTQPLFRAERVVLAAFGARSNDLDVAALAKGQAERFAVWRVEARRADELLLADRFGTTMSWLSVGPRVLRFGSAVVPGRGQGLSLPVRAILPLHRGYSRLLLAGAARRLEA
ncbi:MAG: hypothetical protein AAF218_01850 [Pseudomonadota bacterium]